MRYFNFGRLVQKYSRPFVCKIKETGYYDDLGEWYAPPPKRYEAEGAVMSISSSKLYHSDGAYAAKDKSLYMLSPIDSALLNAEIIFNNNVYRVESDTGCDEAEYTGVYSYVLKWVSVFEGGF